MSQIKKIIQEEIVDPRVIQGAISTYGHIIRINNNNTARVLIFDKQVNEYVTYDNVPLTDTSNGVVSTSLEERDKVWIEYIGGNKNTPRVSGLKEKNSQIISIRENSASDDGQGLPDIGGIFGKLGDLILGLISK